MKTAFVLSIGVINPNTGKTQFDWGIYDTFWNNNMHAFLAGYCLIFSSSESNFEIGEKVTLRNNDSQRKIKDVSIIDKCICSREALLNMLLKNGYDYFSKTTISKKQILKKIRYIVFSKRYK